MDKFKELKNDILFKPNTDKVVAVVQLKGPYPHWYRKGRCLEVRILSLGVCVSASVSVPVCPIHKEDSWCVSVSEPVWPSGKTLGW